MKKRSRAFTFIEILVVTAIISLLTGSSTVIYTSFSNQSRDARRKSDLEQIRSALETYRSNKEDGSYPASLSFGSGSITDGTSIYLNKIPQDPKQDASYSYQISGTTMLGSQTYNTSYILSANLEDDTKYCVTPYTQSVVQKGQSCGEFAVAVIPPTSTPAPIQPTNTPAPIQPTNTPIPQPTSTPIPQPTNTPIPQPTATPTPTPRYASAFVTSTTYTGNLGGVVGANAKCQERAQAAGFPGIYKAWISDSTSSPSQTFNKSGGPWKLMDGSVVAYDWNGLANGSSGAPSGYIYKWINMTELGTEISNQVWSSTYWQYGVWSGYHCNNWTSANSSDIGSTGLSTTRNQIWTGGNTYGYSPACNTQLPLYCFQQTNF